MAAMMNLLEYAETLEQGGFSAEQARTAARALGRAVNGQVASMSALLELGSKQDRRFDDMEASMRRGFEQSRHETNMHLAEFKRETDVRFEQLDSKIDVLKAETKADLTQLESKLIMWMVSIFILQSGTTALLFKFIH